MAIEINVPDIGADQVEITEILVKVGDTVTVEQSLITVEGDKTSMEIPSPKAGIVREIKVSVGDKIKTGKLLMILDSGAGVMTKNVYVPDIGGDEVEVTEILVKEGDTVAIEQSLITVEGDKTAMEVPAPFAGVVKEIKISTGDKVSTGSLVMLFEVIGSAESTTIPTLTAAPALQVSKHTEAFADKTVEDKSEFAVNDAYIHATPLIRRLAREFGVNLAKLKGSGRKGRILCEDVQAYVKNMIKCVETTSDISINRNIPDILPWPKVNFSKFGEVEEIELNRIQKSSGANLTRNWVMIPHVTHFDKVDITDLEAFRKKQNAEAEKRKLNLKFTPVVFAMKAASAALKQMPRFNSSLSEDGRRLILKKYINISIAVDTPHGLVVPVIKDVNKKSITELSYELSAVSKKARDGKLTASEMQGGCFTISSIGGLGTTHFSPIINAPEVAILGISKSAMEPVWNNNEFVPRLMMPIALSFDHRVIDGADGARFITIINNMLSDIRCLVI